jgi:hypothetical protein
MNRRDLFKGLLAVTVTPIAIKAAQALPAIPAQASSAPLLTPEAVSREALRVLNQHLRVRQVYDLERDQYLWRADVKHGDRQLHVGAYAPGSIDDPRQAEALEQFREAAGEAIWRELGK